MIPLLEQVGAGGRGRTDTGCYAPRILSPVRLPFRHTGILFVQLFCLECLISLVKSEIGVVFTLI